MNSHELCYATSDSPVKGFQYGGILVSNGDVGLEGVPDVKHARFDTGNTHGSIIELNGKYFVFYHRHSNRKQSSRQAMAEEICFEDGKFYQAEMTSCGLNGGPLEGKGTYPSYIVCNLYGKRDTFLKHDQASEERLSISDSGWKRQRVRTGSVHCKYVRRCPGRL